MRGLRPSLFAGAVHISRRYCTAMVTVLDVVPDIGTNFNPAGTVSAAITVPLAGAAFAASLTVAV